MLKKITVLFLFLLFSFMLYADDADSINLSTEYSMDNFRIGINSFNETQYEQAILFFLKSIEYNENNNLARYFLGKSYLKAGYENNALFVWNTLASMDYKKNLLKNKLSLLYKKRGMLKDIFIDKDYLLRVDLAGYYKDDSQTLFLNPSQITVDSQNNYFVASFLTNNIVELNSNLQVVRTYFSIYPKLGKPFGVARDKEGFLYVSDFKNDVVLKINKYNITEGKIGYKGVGKGGLIGPKYLLFDDEDNLFVCDSGNNRINKYRKNGDILLSFGNGENGGNGPLKSPSGLFYDNGKIFVCDRDNNRVLSFDKNGNFISTFGKKFLNSPYDITKDKYDRFIILCQHSIWAYEENNALWYKIDALGKRLKRGISIVRDVENNMIVSDFNSSKLYVLSPERERYSNLSVSINRIVASSFPSVHLFVTIQKDDFTIPVGITSDNIRVAENGYPVSVVGTYYTVEKNKKNDILVVVDENQGILKYKSDLHLMMNKWMQSISKDTSVCLVGAKNDKPVVINDFGSTRLDILDSIDNLETGNYSDKGSALKLGIYHSLDRFSKKAVVIITNSFETQNDFEKFKLEECISLAANNSIPIFVVSFDNGNLTDLYQYIAKKTGGKYYKVYSNKNLYSLFTDIEKNPGKQMVLSYKSRAVSRFNMEPINVELEINYSNSVGKDIGVYYPFSGK